MGLRAMQWRDGTLRLLDQRRLPLEQAWLELADWRAVVDAIRDMAVRGAPAIGIAAAYGMALACAQGADRDEARAAFAAARPTAVNLFWALDRLDALPWEPEAILECAQQIESEDLAANLRMAKNAAALIPQEARILTICNTGALATAGHGTALGVVRTARDEGKHPFVYACETRPRQQGLKLTAWELLTEEIPFSVIADGVAGSLMAAGQVTLVLVGADRIAANGDTANKVGTYSLAVLARYHGLPFYVAAPESTIDSAIASGAEIPIEERTAEELTHFEGICAAPSGCPVFNPAFDVTPAKLITAIVTERAVYSEYRFARQPVTPA